MSYMHAAVDRGRHKSSARAWFESLQTKITAALKAKG
jgi:hypothetical protein